MTKTNTIHKKDPQKQRRLGTAIKKLLEGLNMFDGTNLILISGLDHGT